MLSSREAARPTLQDRGACQSEIPLLEAPGEDPVQAYSKKGIMEIHILDQFKTVLGSNEYYPTFENIAQQALETKGRVYSWPQEGR